MNSRVRVTLLATAVPVVIVLIAMLALSATLVQADPGVTITKSAPDVAIAGTELFYDIHVSNDGITDTNAYVTDTLPAEVVYIADTGGCTEAGGVLTCPLGDLEPGAYRDFEVKTYVAPDAVAGEDDGTIVIANTASVSSTEEYAETSEETFVEDLADLRVIKMSKPDTEIVAGEEFAYTIFVDNLGPSAARNVRIIDTLITEGRVQPTGCSMSVPSPTGITYFNCDFAARSGVWTLGSFGAEPLWPYSPDNIGRITIGMTAIALQGGDINNEVRVTADTPDPDQSNNVYYDFLSAEDTADLEIVKTADAGSVVAGGNTSWTVTVTNHGPSPAENVQVIDVLPAGLVDGSLVVSAGCTPGTPGDPTDPLVCNLGTLAVGASRSVTIAGDVDPAFVLNQPDSPAANHLDNDAWVLSDTFDPDNGNNRDSDYVSVEAQADLSLQKYAVGTPKAGAEIHYEYQIANAGPSWSGDVTLRDFLPRQVQFLSAYVDWEGGTGGVPLPCDVMAGSNSLFCPLGDIPLTGGTPILVFVNVRIKPDATGSLVNAADVNLRDTPDPNTANNSDSVTLEILYEADLSITKTSEPMKIYPGEQKLYHIEVTNHGPANAPDVIVTDTLPISVTYEIDNDNCEQVGWDPDVLECHLGTIPAGQTVGFDISALVDPLASAVEITNTAVVSMPYDTNVGNNIATATNLVQEPIMADLELQKTPSTTNPTAGTSMNFTLLVTNHGPVAAENVVLEDMLPEGVSVWAVNPGPGSCTTGTPGSEPLRCNLGALGVDAPATVIVSVYIDPDYMGTLENDAVVSSDIHDQNNSNNRDYVIVNVSTSSNVFLKKGCGWASQVLAGEQIQYDILLTNNGPSTVHNFELWDLLPDEVTFLSYEILPGGGECFYTPQFPPMHGGPGQGLHCYLGDVAPDATRIVYVRVRIDPDAPEGSLTNRVTDWDAESNVSLVGPPANRYCSNTVVNRADLSIRKTADPWKVFAGDQIRYDVSVTNNGPGHAYTVTVTDTLPPGVAFELSTDPDCTPADGQVVCDWEMLAVGETRSFSLFGQVEPDATPGTVSNVVTVSSDSFDPVGYNDRATAPNLIQGRADLKIRKFGKPDGLVRAGDKLTYTVIVDNLGTGYAHDVHVLDQMNSSGVFELLSIGSNMLPGHWSCTESSGTFTETLALQCSLTDTLPVLSPSGGRWILTVVVQANEPQDINNVAYVDGSDYDPDLSNNEAIAEHEITAVADLALTKEAWGQMLVGCDGATEEWLNEVAAGGTVTYTLTVSNTGPSTAENVVVLDEPLPPPDRLEIDVQSITPSQGNCQTAHIVDQRRLSCNLGTISPEMTATVSFVAHVPSWVPDATVLVNDAQAYSDMFDGNNGNDIVSNQTVVSRVADLEVGKTQEPETTLPGLEVVYTIVVTNTGPSDAHGVLISDTLPFTPTTDITMECCASDGGQCDVPCEPPTCPAGECPWPEVDFIAQADIPAGEWVIYTLTAIPEWVPCDTITNTAEVVAPLSLMYEGDIDPCPDNDVATTTSDPECNFVPLALKEYPGPDSPP